MVFPNEALDFSVVLSHATSQLKHPVNDVRAVTTSSASINFIIIEKLKTGLLICSRDNVRWLPKNAKMHTFDS